MEVTMRCPTSALLALAALPLWPQGPPEGSFWEARFHLTSGLGSGPGTLAGDLHGHLGLGTGLALGHAFNETHRLRAVLDYGGTRVDGVPVARESPFWDGGDLSDISRTLRLGLEHQVALTEGGRVRFFYGGGYQNSWVARTQDSYAKVTTLTMLEAFGFIQAEAFHTLSQRSVLDAWFPYGTLGLGLERDHGFAELRVVGGTYQRWLGSGLSATAIGRAEERLGVQLVFTVGYRGW